MIEQTLGVGSAENKAKVQLEAEQIPGNGTVKTEANPEETPKAKDGNAPCPMDTSGGVPPSDAPSAAQTPATSEPASLTPQQLQVMNRVGIETAQECQVHLTAEELRDYAKGRFDIEEVTVRQFK